MVVDAECSSRVSCRSTVYLIRCSSWRTIRESLVSDDSCGRWSIDELPQLVNVIAGDMSLVGPRPEQVELVARYSDEQRRVRLALRPGMTGPMQVYGRGLLSLSERVAVERDYVENLSIGRDLRILGMTLPVVLGRRGAY